MLLPTILPGQHYIVRRNVHYSNVVEMHFCLVIDFFRIQATDNTLLLEASNWNQLLLYETIDLIIVVGDDVAKNSILEAKIGSAKIIIRYLEVSPSDPIVTGRKNCKICIYLH